MKSKSGGILDGRSCFRWFWSKKSLEKFCSLRKVMWERLERNEVGKRSYIISRRGFIMCSGYNRRFWRVCYGLGRLSLGKRG